MGPSEYVPRIEETELKRNRKTGYWEIRWTVPASQTGNGRARTRTRSCFTKDHGLATTIRREYLAAVVTTAKMVAGHTIADLITLYKRDHMSPNGTSPTQAESLKAPSRLLGAIEPSQITSMDIASFRTARVAGLGGARQVSLGTVRRELGALRAVLNWAQREGHLPKDFHQPHIALPPEGHGRDSYLDGLDEARLHDACVEFAKRKFDALGRAALFVLIALNTAARAESIESLTWDRVDLRRRIVDFRDTSRRLTKKRRVPVPISNRLYRPLARAWISQGKPKVGPVLMKFGSTRKGFEELRRIALPGLEFTRHDLRRTWATLAAQRGVSMFDIAGVLGDTLPTVEKHYAVHSPTYLRDAINRRG